MDKETLCVAYMIGVNSNASDTIKDNDFQIDDSEPDSNSPTFESLKDDADGDVHLAEWIRFLRVYHAELDHDIEQEMGKDTAGDTWLRAFLLRIRRGAESAPEVDSDVSDETDDLVTLPTNPVTMLTLLVN